MVVQEPVVLVDQQDRKIGLMGKLEAHQGAGKLHRAVSVLLYRKDNGTTQVLLQRRSKHKPLWPLVWSNAVCTHPQHHERYLACGTRRLREELGISLPSRALRRLFRFEYRAKYDEDLSEHELDTVFVGTYSGALRPDPSEVAATRWTGWKELTLDIRKHRDQYTPWFRMIVHYIEENQRYRKRFLH